ncbi:MAG: exopolyphosphatase [Gammaproteobacteria bacterium]|nr:exopolyphosphatase [Gammaproteobacteria bacterium]
MSDKNQKTTLAAIDLGSNSFHMIIANMVDGNITVVDRIRDSVRLAAGLDEKGNITPEATERALECLRQFGQRLQGLPDAAVSAVGTNTLRKAKNSNDFLIAAHKALGYEIETITGLEEARLIYLGVAHSMAGAAGRRLVVDIGGGSTELIVGEEFSTLYRESLYMGCVSMSRKWFANGKLTNQTFRSAHIQAMLELRSVQDYYASLGWQTAIGASGSIKSIGKVSEQMGWSETGITAESLAKIRQAMLEAGDLKHLKLKGLSDERLPVFPGGVIVLSAVFEALKIERMLVSDGSLREGLIYDQIDRTRHEDVRDNSIRAFSERFNADQAHVKRVSKTAMCLYAECESVWKLDKELKRLLVWATEVHEAGLTISHSQYHKHGAYLVEYTDLAGFTREQQRSLAVLVRSHRRKFSKKLFDTLPGKTGKKIKKIAVIFRLAVLLHRSRRDRSFSKLKVDAGKKSLHLTFPDAWLDEHPLSKADLVAESKYLAAAGFELRFE